jgi:WD40 repeat protein
MDVNDLNANIFVTGSGDTTVKLWDIREKKSCVCTFRGSSSSVNCVKFLPGTYQSIIAGSEDSKILLYDLRALKELGSYKKSDSRSISSLCFSKSGQILFATTANSNEITMWDIFDEGEPFAHYTHV